MNDVHLCFESGLPTEACHMPALQWKGDACLARFLLHRQVSSFWYVGRLLTQHVQHQRPQHRYMLGGPPTL